MFVSGKGVKIVKNKVAPPFKTVEFDIMYGEGISKAGEIIDLGVTANIIEKSGSWFAYGGNKLGQGKENAKQHIMSNPKLLLELENKIKQYFTAGNDDLTFIPSEEEIN